MLLALCLPAFATNVLVIVADDLGADKIEGFTDPASPADYLPSTPTLDDLRAGGITFTDAWANPVCSPTRASLHTGQPAYVHGIGYALSTGEAGLNDATWATLGEGAQAAGYATGAFGKWHIGALGNGGTTDWELAAGDPSITRMERPHPAGAGFDAYVGDLDGIMSDYDAWTRVTYPGSSGVNSSDLEWDTDPVEDVIVDEAINWIGAQTGDWFAMVNFYAPHTKGGHGVYDADELYSTCPGDACVDAGTCPDMNGDGDTDDDVARIVYANLVECMDDRIETLLAGIPDLVLEDTVVVFMGDNGTPEDVLEGEYADAGSRPANGKESVYETGVHVPMIVTDGESWLDVIAGRPPSSDIYPNPGDTYEGPTTTTDIHDTALGWMEGVPRRYTTTFSRDLTGALAAGATLVLPARRCTAWTEVYDTPSVDDAAAACRSGDWKLVMDVDAGGTCVIHELYDLSTDPFEHSDVSATNSVIVTALWNDVLSKGIGWLPTVVCP